MTAGRLAFAVVAGVVVTCRLALAQGVAPTPASPGEQRRESRVAYDLKSAVETALQNHPTLSVASARREAATTRMAVAGAQYRPFVEGRASVGGTLAGDDDVAFRDDVATRSFRSNPYYTGALRLVLPLVREATSPFLTLPSEVVARAGHASARQAERLARAEIVGNVTMAFYSMLAVREELNTSREIVDLSRALHESVRRRVEQQLLPPVDLLAVESALISAQAQVGAAEANLAKARELFALALGLDPSSEATRTLDVVDTASSRPVLLPLDDMLKHMTTAHPSVLIQQAKVREAEAALGLLRTERYPTLDAVMAIGAVDDFNPPADGWSLRALLRLNWNIYDFGVLKLKIKQQHEVVGAERHALELVRNRLSQSLVTAYHNLTASRTRLAAAEKAIELAGEEVRVAERRQQQGVAPESDVLRGRVKQATARRAAAQAHYATLIEEAVVAMSTVAE